VALTDEPQDGVQNQGLFETAGRTRHCPLPSPGLPGLQRFHAALGAVVGSIHCRIYLDPFSGFFGYRDRKDDQSRARRKMLIGTMHNGKWKYNNKKKQVDGVRVSIKVSAVAQQCGATLHCCIKVCGCARPVRCFPLASRVGGIDRIYTLGSAEGISARVCPAPTPSFSLRSGMV
jgi:hypothetical protein